MNLNFIFFMIFLYIFILCYFAFAFLQRNYNVNIKLLKSMYIFFVKNHNKINFIYTKKLFINNFLNYFMKFINVFDSLNKLKIKISFYFII